MSTSEVVKLNDVRLSFPKLFVPKSFQKGQPERFEASFLLDPTNKKHAATIEIIRETAEMLLLSDFNGSIPDSTKLCFSYSDASPIEMDSGTYEWRGVKKSYDGYEGMFSISSSNRARPTVVDQGLTPLVEADGKPYPGCFVNASITLWVQDNEYGKRVNANLRAVQFLRDGEAFGVKPAEAEEEFDVVEVDDLTTDDDDFDLD